jgi:hypothetical protein
MKWTLAYLLDLAHKALNRRYDPAHDDSLRANRFGDPAHTFGFWRSLVS